MGHNRGIVSGWDTTKNIPKGVTSPAMMRTSLASIARAEGIMMEAGAATLTREALRMAVSWSAFTAVIASPLGGWLCPRIEAGSIDLRVGDATYPRVDVVWVRQWDYQVAGDHPDSEVQVGVVTGTPSATPQVPAVPVGALAVFTVTVPKGATAGTDVPSSGVTRCRWTAPLDGTPVGVVSAFAGSAAPLGYLLCQGQEVSVADYPELWSVIGAVYGAGTSSSGFRLPDLRTRVPVGRSAEAGALAVLGAVGGTQTHKLTEAEMPAHRHQQGGHTFLWGASGDVGTDATAVGSPSTGNRLYTWQNADGWARTHLTGAGAAHNNMPPYTVMNYVIRAI